MKTYEEWQSSDQKFTEFFKPMDEIDESTYNHIMEVVAPHYCCVAHNGGWWGQNGECYIKIDGISHYMTVFESPEGRFYYIGVAPEFK